MKLTDKVAEIERSVSEARARYYSLKSRVETPRASVRTLVDARQPVRRLLNTAHNAELCSLMYGDSKFRPQLSQVKQQVRDLAETLEHRIEGRYPRNLNLGSLAGMRSLVTSRLALGPEPDGYFTAAPCERTAVPVYALRYREVADSAGFVHREYAVWFRSNRVFSTGFAGWPTEHNWTTVRCDRELLPAVVEAVEADGFRVGGDK